jgi:hypothetical protein
MERRDIGDGPDKWSYVTISLGIRKNIQMSITTSRIERNENVRKMGKDPPEIIYGRNCNTLREMVSRAVQVAAYWSIGESLLWRMRCGQGVTFLLSGVKNHSPSVTFGRIR